MAYIYFVCLFLGSMLLTGCGSSAPDTKQIESYLSQKVSSLYSVGDLKCETFPAQNGAEGRISCKGMLKLKVPLYVRKDHLSEAAGAVAAGIDEEAAITHADAFYNWRKFYAIGHKPGAETPFEGDLRFVKEVDGWRLFGRPEFAALAGVPETELKDDGVIVGSAQYNTFIEEAREELRQRKAVKTAFLQGIQQYFSAGKVIDVFYINYKGDQEKVWSIEVKGSMKWDLKGDPWGSPREGICYELGIRHAFAQCFTVEGEAKVYKEPESKGVPRGQDKREVRIEGYVRPNDPLKETNWTAETNVADPSSPFRIKPENARWNGERFVGGERRLDFR